MPNGSVIRGNFRRQVALGANFLMVGDSLNQTYVIHSIMNTMYTVFPTPCKGGRTGMQNSAGGGWPLSINCAGGTVRSIRPGDLAGDSSSGFNIMPTAILEPGATDISNFGSPIQVTLFPTSGWEQNWDTNQDAKAIIVYATDPVAANPDLWRVQAWNRANTSLGDIIPNLDFEQATAVRWRESAPFARGSGVFNVPLRVSTWSESEINSIIKAVTMGFKITSKTSGIFWGYAGHGGWNTLCHASATGVSLPAEPATYPSAYTARYTDETLRIDFEAYEWNVVGIWLGQNVASNETGGPGNIGSYKQNIVNIISRYKTQALAAGKPIPYFVLFSTYDTNDDRTRFLAMAQALREIALADTYVEYVDTNDHVFTTYGLYSTHQPANLADGVHPSSLSFRQSIANFSWSTLNGPITVGGVLGSATLPAIASGLGFD